MDAEPALSIVMSDTLEFERMTERQPQVFIEKTDAVPIL